MCECSNCDRCGSKAPSDFVLFCFDHKLVEFLATFFLTGMIIYQMAEKEYRSILNDGILNGHT